MHDSCPSAYLANELHIGIVVVVGASGDFHQSISHANVLGIRPHVFGSGHSDDLDGPLHAKRLEGP